MTNIVSSDMDINSLESYFQKSGFPINVFHYTTIDSTNEEAKRILDKGQSCPALLVADSQTNGKGRLGRNFYSSDHSGLYFSVLFPHISSLQNFVTVTSAVSVIAEQTIRNYTNTDPKIKWVNDILIDNKKVCGILCETVCPSESDISLIVGIGINLNTEQFPEDLLSIAGSISLDSSKKVCMLFDITSDLYTYMQQPDFSKYLNEYKLQSCILGKKIFYIKNNLTSEGTAYDIDENGFLLVRLQDGSMTTLSTGEISVRPIS